VIGQAKGVLMAPVATGDDHAFRMLVSASQETIIKLVDVARWLADEATQGRSGTTTPSDAHD
jgi:AmiR/NasT family two-component response regulator